MRKNKCLIDTSALIALNDVSDQYHDQAKQLASSLTGQELIVTNAILTETYTLLRYRMGYKVAHHFLKTVLEEDEFMVAEVTPSFRTSALQLLTKFNDQKISYCNALSVVIMKELGIQKIFSFDRQFDIMGLNGIHV